jgi:multimeric flavodoxin WrbA
MKKIVVINAGPRTTWNTATLVRDAAQGAQDAGADVQVFDLYQLEPFTGCRSCFACMTEKCFGKCVFKDGLSDTLEKMRNADGIILGSPNYFGRPTAGFRALFERLCFQYLTYNKSRFSCNDRKVPVLFIMTSNAPDTLYTGLVQRYQQTLSGFVGPTDILISGDTLQLKDYSKLDWEWSIFDPEAKKLRHETVFPQECQAAFDKGAKLVR